MNIPNLSDGDLVLTVHTDNAAFMGVADINTYDLYDFNWDWDRLCAKTVERMNLNGMLAWGCPEQRLSIRVTLGSLPQALNCVESVSSLFQVTGTLCLCNYTSITMCAQFDDYKLPQPEDGVFTVPPGTYCASLHRMFNWQHGEQFSESLNEGDHYVLVFELWISDLAHNSFTQIPWVIG